MRSSLRQFAMRYPQHPQPYALGYNGFAQESIGCVWLSNVLSYQVTLLYATGRLLEMDVEPLLCCFEGLV